MGGGKFFQNLRDGVLNGGDDIDIVIMYGHLEINEK